MTTRTGRFPIGFRRGPGQWQANLQALAEWSKQTGFEAIDLMKASAQDVAALRRAELPLGSVDLAGFDQLMHDDPGKRRDAIAAALAYVKEIAAAGAKIFFACIMPGDPARDRAENYALAVESYAPIAAACAAAGASLAVEGWPGFAPHLANLCCNPETTRAFLKDVGRGAGLNYDPSHLIRLQIDHVRFLKEFAPHVRHVHAKDTAIDSEALYQFGTQPSAFVRAHDWGEWIWRYTIPGHGAARWGDILRILTEAGFKGVVSVELEDENFNGSETGEKAGFTHSLQFLSGV